MQQIKEYPLNIFQGVNFAPSLLESFMLLFVKTKKKICIDTDNLNRELYTLEYKVLKENTFITNFYKGIK